MTRWDRMGCEGSGWEESDESFKIVVVCAFVRLESARRTGAEGGDQRISKCLNGLRGRDGSRITSRNERGFAGEGIFR
jgi:hypothetical protein